jgi:putative ATP-grasp target RiPP
MPARSPWGLTRLSPFATVTVIPPYTMELDPETQTGRGVLADNSVITFGHRKTYKATETGTHTNKGDGASHRQQDPDTDQDSQED